MSLCLSCAERRVERGAKAQWGSCKECRISAEIEAAHVNNDEEQTLVLESIATWYVGHRICLRTDLGGGMWEVISLLESSDGFHRCIARRVKE